MTLSSSWKGEPHHPGNKKNGIPMTDDVCAGEAAIGGATPGMAAIDALQREPNYAAYVGAEAVLDRGGSACDGLSPVRVAFLSNFTVDPVLPVLRGGAMLSGLKVDTYVASFDAIMAEIADGASGLHTFRPDVVALALWLPSMSPTLCNRFCSLSAEDVESVLDDVEERTAAMIVGLRARLPSVPILVNNYPLPRVKSLGILDAQLPHGQVAAILELNRRLAERVWDDPYAYLVDFLQLLAGIKTAWQDERYWHIARVPFGQEALVAVGELYARFICALRGRLRKCLVLDCDNTLWGGIIGEDGLSGIRLGGQYPGSCYLAFQEEILNLHDRGVLVALCSRNNEEDVLQVLREHPDMLVREEHIATWRVNWGDKAENLARIAEDLNIGLDSLVFVDDSPFECERVRQRFPGVAVLQLPRDVSTYRHALVRRGFFDSLSISGEDRERTRMYRSETKRRELKTRATSLEDYLRDLDLVAEVAVPSGAELARVAQLTQKTNQFNLTTRRHTDGEIADFAGRNDAKIHRMRLKDRVSDLGIIGVAISEHEGDTATLETFLLSCRSLGRGAEDALLWCVLSDLRSCGCVSVRGLYRPTRRNQQVAGFYERNGCTRGGADEEEVEWLLDLTHWFGCAPEWIEIVTQENQGV